MDQLVVLQEIYESFSRGGDKLRDIPPKSIKGTCSELVGKLLEGWKKGRIDEEICLLLLERLQDVFEIKRLGDICRKAGHFGLAIRSYNRALSLCSDASVRAVLHNNLGQAYALQGDLARAALYFQKAANGFECAGDKSGQAHVLGNLGSAYRRAGDWDRAIEHTYRSLKTFEERGDGLGTAQMAGSLGRIYADMGERDLAERYFEQSLKDFQRLGDKRSAAWVLNRLGRISFERKDWDEALAFYNQSLSLFEELENRPGAGIALLSMGRMYLAMDQAAAARESLERALLLVPKGPQPARLNTLSCLAATYSSLAGDLLREAALSRPEDDGDRALGIQASQAFARASDRYLELDSVLKGQCPEIRAAAGIAMSRSYLARLWADVSDQERVALAERAAACLDDAVASSAGQKRSRIEGLQRTLIGMKDALSIGLLRSEPWKLAGAVASATENLSSGLGWGEANAPLGEALKSLSASIEAERARRDPGEDLRAAASNLRLTKEQFSLLGTAQAKRSALQMEKAAQLLERLVDAKAASPRAQSRASLADGLNRRPEREALLLIARVSAENTLAELDDVTPCYTWDESLNLVEGQVSAGERAARIPADPIPEIRRPVPPERDRARDEILVEDEAETEGEEILVSGGGMLVPVRSKLARTPGPQIFMHRELPFSKETEIVPAKREMTIQTAPAKQVIDAAPEKESEPGDDRETSASVPADPIISEFFQGPQPTGNAGTRESLLSQSNGILLLKAMTLVVVLLLAIDTVLYLI